MLEMLSEMLASLGYRCLPTSDPEEALKYVGTGKCRIVLSDLKMPGMSGMKFLERALRRGSRRLRSPDDRLLLHRIRHRSHQAWSL